MKQIEYGDFQTPQGLTQEVIKLLSEKSISPNIVVEPTCGLGNFIEASYNQWDKNIDYFGFEIDEAYYINTKKRFLKRESIIIQEQNFFSFDWKSFFEKFQDKNPLIIGNPPWVNSATIGLLNGKNLPKKSNFVKLKGFEAKMGKANFDIAEWITIELIDSASHLNGHLALLCKTATARKVLSYFWKQERDIGEATLYNIDAKKDFDVSVDASLLLIDFSKKSTHKRASVYSSLLANKVLLYQFGFYNNQLISNLINYEKYKYLDGFSNYTWRSGIKHDASKVMELTTDKEGKLINGFGEAVDIEDTYLYPLLKSSDIANSRLTPRKFVIITQKKVGEETSKINEIAPKTWAYLNLHSQKLNGRKSSIYKNKPPFSIFGIGEYSFSSWKIAISGLYKKIQFNIISPYKEKPIMLDDTCYSIPCNSKEEAEYWVHLLNRDESKKFLYSLIFEDAKRPITVDVLKRLNMGELAKRFSKVEVANEYLTFSGMGQKGQASFVFEESTPYNQTPFPQ